MIKQLGPTREEALVLLVQALRVCDADGERQGYSCANFAVNAIYADGIINNVQALSQRSLRLDLNEYTRNVCRFCADVLQWVHDEERRLELDILGFVLPTLVVKVDPVTRAPLDQKWPYIAGELERFLKYEVEVSGCVTLRHFVLAFDIGSGKFVVTEKDQS